MAEQMKPAAEEEGVKAVIYLQALVGINETEESALKGWREMSYQEKKMTMEVYESFKKTSAEPDGRNTSQ